MNRNVKDSFWTDSKVENNFTPEDKYFFLYLLTNPYLNMSGCFEVSINRVAYETGYTSDTIKSLLDRFMNVHHVITYDENTSEILINNYDMNWNSGEKVDAALLALIDDVHSPVLKNILIDKYNQRENVECLETVDIPENYNLYIAYTYPIDNLYIGLSNTNTNTNTKSKSNTISKSNTKTKEQETYSDNQELNDAIIAFIDNRKKIKKPMTDLAIKKFLKKLDQIASTDQERIEILNEAIIGGWQGIYPLDKKKPKQKPGGYQQRNYDYADMERKLLAADSGG